MLKTAIITAGIALALAAPGAKADVFTEAPGDAGRTLATADVFMGNEVIDQIRGTLRREGGVDMFAIYIPDPAEFRARVTNNTDIEDTQLFLFDDRGFGVIANDDINDNNLKSRIRDFIGDAGVYYLAITSFNNDPRSASGRIFPNRPFDAEVGPTAAGGNDPLLRWRQNEEGETGDYRINLRGARTVSEPATLALLGTALVGFAGLRRRRA